MEAPIQARPTLVTNANLVEMSQKEVRRYRRRYGITGRQMRKEIKRQRRMA